MLFCVLAVLFAACTRSEKIPADNTDISFDAVYTAGDFDFKCNIKWRDGTSFVTVTSTNAAGMTMSCDGRNVVFTKGAMLRKESVDNIDASNPARLLYEVFTALENGGNRCSLGTFDVAYSEGEIDSITVSDITIKASSKQ